MSRDMMAKFEALVTEIEEKQAMSDALLHNLGDYTEKEIAQAIREGVVTLEQVAIQLNVDSKWEEL